MPCGSTGKPDPLTPKQQLIADYIKFVSKRKN